MKNIKSSFLSIAIMLNITLITMFAPSVYAESQCKGLVKNDCDKQASCSWVDAYERKDGKKVGAFCRSKPKQKSN